MPLLKQFLFVNIPKIYIGQKKMHLAEATDSAWLFYSASLDRCPLIAGLFYTSNFGRVESN
jgi:hypothetical protein